MLVLLAVLPATVVAASPDRPTIGVALGGGGARGLAHIGVLERLDELRIPVDRVAGTSMGAVVGSLYCLGFHPQEIDQNVRQVDWRLLMTDRPDRRQISFRRKSDDMNHLWPFEFGITSNGLALQRGLIAGQKFASIFSAPDLYTAGYRGFDDLPIPFRPVATDLVTGEIVVLESGNLMRAVRASMAAPGAFPPVSIDGRTLVDGYLRTMVPVDVVRDMGADVVIGVHVGWAPGETPPGKEWDLPSILLQANYLLAWSNTAPELAGADVAVVVRQPDIPLYDLTQVAAAIEAGRRAVDAMRDELLPLALSEADYERWRAGVGRRSVEPPIIESIDLDNPTRVSSRTILKRITQAPGDTLDVPRLAHDLGRVYALGVFESVDYSLRGELPGVDLVIEPTEKPYLPWILRFGAAIRINNNNRGQIQLVSRITRLELNQLGGEMRADVVVGSRIGAAVEWYQPLEHSRTVFVVPSLFAGSHSEDVFDGSYRVGSFRTDTWGGHLGLGLNVSRFGEIRGTYWRGGVRTRVDSGQLDNPGDDSDAGAVNLRIGYDQLDNHAIPTAGIAGSFQTWHSRTSLGDTYDYDRYWGHLIAATTAGRWTLQTRVQAGGSEGDLPYYREFRLGGLRDVTGIPDGSLRGGAFGMAGAGALFHVSGLQLPYAAQWHLGAWFDVGNTWDQPSDASFRDLILGGALSVLLETPLGPIEVGYGRSSSGRGTAYLQAGIHFAQPFNI